MSNTIIRADAGRLPLGDKSVDMVCGSPPYTSSRLYLENGKDLGISRDTEAWIEWMLGVTQEALRVSRGLVLWVVSGRTEDWNYQPAPEGLLYRWWAQGGECHCFRPCYWHRSGISGSGGEQWYRADVEYVLAFKRPGKLAYGDPKANGHKPKWEAGGAVSHRDKHGIRANSHRETYRPGAKFITAPRANGKTEIQGFVMPDIANPGVVVFAEHDMETGDFLHTNAGGGKLGSPLAHKNEAPYPVDVPKFFINSHVPPGGTVLDPFSGSGTTGHAAMDLARNYIGCDLRQSQCLLTKKRLGTITPSFAFDESDEAVEVAIHG